jgi:hypothetical protein
MALELNKLTTKINELGKYTVARNQDLDKRVELARTVLKSLASSPEDIAKIADSISQRFRWAGAIPTNEPMMAAFDPPQRPTRLNVIAADGSQIKPDRHNLALYYVINVGSIVFRYGTTSAPDVFRHPELFFEDEELYYEEESSVLTDEMIAAKRNVRELGELARLGAIESPTAPTVALLDNGLLLYLALREQNPRFGKEIVRQYFEQLNALKTSNTGVAGVVDRPRSANVVRLIHLAGKNVAEITQETLREVNRVYKHVVDTTLFDFLEPGQRSALFVLASPDSVGEYAVAGHKIYFFFLNAGESDNLLRVEVPEWVAMSKEKLDLVHTAIVAQCKTGGYPYVLARAHEEAVIKAAEKFAVDEMVASALANNGVPFRISLKQLNKNLLSNKRRYGR